MKLGKFVSNAKFLVPMLAGLVLTHVSEAAQVTAQWGFIQVAMAETDTDTKTDTECHVTIQGENGETLTACKSEDGHGEKVEGEVPMERIERAFRIDTSQGTFGGPNAVGPHAVDQINEVGAKINEVGAKIGRVFGW